MYITEENKSKTVEHLNKELSKILEEKELNKDTLHCIYEIVDVLKDLSEIDEKEMEVGGYSQGMRYDHRMMPRNSYDNYRNNGYGNSYNSYGSDPMMDQWMSQATNEHERALVRQILASR